MELVLGLLREDDTACTLDLIMASSWSTGRVVVTMAPGFVVHVILGWSGAGPDLDVYAVLLGSGWAPCVLLVTASDVGWDSGI